MLCLADHDKRLMAICASACWGSPSLILHLVEELKKCQASPVVARILCEGLKVDRAGITPEAIVRLGVETDDVAFSRLFQHCGGVANFRSALRGFLNDLSVQADANLEMGSPHAGVDLERINEYLRVFVCAYAMIRGVAFDPRALAA